MKLVPVDYATFWSLVSSKGLLAQYTSTVDAYYLFAVETAISWEVTVPKDNGANQTDFETNRKSTCNQPLEIKAGPGRPNRVSASPQPINTIQHFKGYMITLPVLTTSSYIDVSFPNMVYIRGGTFYCSSILAGDSVSVDLLLASNSMVVLPGLVSSCFLVPNIPVPFQSSESMALSTDFKLRITLSGTSSALTSRTVYIIAEFFE